MKQQVLFASFVAAISLGATAQLRPSQPEPPSGWTARKLATAKHYMVAAGHPLAVEAGLEVSRKIQAAPSISLTLRYIEEVTETTGSGKNRSSRQVLYCLHEVKQELSSSQFDINSQGEIPISMRLPQGDFSNRLLDTPRRYWELEIKAETPGIDYDARFLLPVYGSS